MTIIDHVSDTVEAIGNPVAQFVSLAARGLCGSQRGLRCVMRCDRDTGRLVRCLRRLGGDASRHAGGLVRGISGLCGVLGGRGREDRFRCRRFGGFLNRLLILNLVDCGSRPGRRGSCYLGTVLAHAA
jgi:hypothetical protein